MSLFFFVSGMFTAPSLARKGTRRFLGDRLVRLGIPMLFFIVLLSPVIEYVDTDNAGWTDGFWAFTLHIWWPPAPGPTWFLGVLLLFSLVYAVVRALRPRHGGEGAAPLHVWHLATVGVLVAVVSYAIRLSVPLGEELWRLAIPQAPGWVAGFTLGILSAERGWLTPLHPRIAKVTRRSAWAALGIGVITLVSTAFWIDPQRLFGGPTWESALISCLEGALVVTMPFWLVDLFRRRFKTQGPILREMSRGAFAAFLFHQLVLVGLVLGSRLLAWPPEVDFLVVSAIGVAGSFLLGSALLRIPGVSRIL
jgi:surface polysaccharide O-acyltransferase-like enzyme